MVLFLTKNVHCNFFTLKRKLEEAEVKATAEYMPLGGGGDVDSQVKGDRS